MEENSIGDGILAAAFKVHTALGPGLLESAYEACLAHELEKNGLETKRQLALPVFYDGIKIDAGYRIDLLVNSRVVVEIKSVEKFAPIHMAQVISYMKLGGFRLGYLLNFNVQRLKDGIKRVAV
jgi:GxxExxY protein